MDLHVSSELHNILSILKLPEEIKHFYEFSILRVFILSTVGLFVPLYIYLKTGNFTLTLLYLTLSLGLFSVLSSFFNIHILKKFGIEILSFLSIIFAIAELALLIFFQELSIILIIVLALLDGFSLAAYWDSFHVSFALFGKRKEVMEEVAGIWILNFIVSFVGPLISGFLVKIFGFRSFFIMISFVVILVSLYLLRHFGKRYTVEFSAQKILFATPHKYLWITLGLFLLAVPLVNILLLEIVSKQIEIFGAIMSLLVILSGLSMYYAAKLFDRGELHYTLIYPSLSSPILMAYSIASTPKIIVLEVIRSLVAPFGIGTYKITYDQTFKLKEAAIGRNVYINLGKLLAGIFYIVINADLRLSLLIGSIFGVAFAISFAVAYKRLKF